jgi:hypothetical protein
MNELKTANKLAVRCDFGGPGLSANADNCCDQDEKLSSQAAKSASAMRKEQQLQQAHQVQAT